MNGRRLVTALGMAAALVLAAACSSDDGAGTSTSATPAPGTGTTPTTLPAVTTAPTNSTDGATASSVGTTLVEDTTADTGEPVLDTVDTTPIPDDTDPPAQIGLPADGPATVGGVDVPAGRVLLGNDQRLAWITDDVVPGAAGVWKALYDVRGQTGLYPVLLFNDAEPAGWEVDAFFPNQPNEIDDLSLDEVMQNAADFYLEPARTFDGLAPASSGTPDEAAADAAVAALPDGRIVLVEAPRGGDALSFMGWTGNSTYDSTEAIAVAIRSWEDRFGARVVAVGPTSVVLTIANPPATADEATALTKELVLLDPDLEAPEAPENALVLGEDLVGLHLWTLWWT